jgi:hypothetical protein
MNRNKPSAPPMSPSGPNLYSTNQAAIAALPSVVYFLIY